MKATPVLIASLFTSSAAFAQAPQQPSPDENEPPAPPVTYVEPERPSTATMRPEEFPGRLLVGAAWEPSVPIASFNASFIDSVSASGVAGHIQYFVIPRVAVGGEMAFNSFRDDAVVMHSTGNADLMAREFRYADIWSTRATGRFYLTEVGVQPYVGLGLGISSASHTVSALDFSTHERSWVFAMTPEVGAIIPVARAQRGESGGGVTVAARWNITSDNYREINNLSFLSAQVGFYWRQ